MSNSAATQPLATPAEGHEVLARPGLAGWGVRPVRPGCSLLGGAARVVLATATAAATAACGPIARCCSDTEVLSLPVCQPALDCTCYLGRVDRDDRDDVQAHPEALQTCCPVRGVEEQLHHFHHVSDDAKEQVQDDIECAVDDKRQEAVHAATTVLVAPLATRSGQEAVRLTEQSVVLHQENAKDRHQHNAHGVPDDTPDLDIRHETP
mmetsp:Transcript_66296/g.153972  ORF Transcript_66296/g.153972 Transcript_66296/m.153972 type:complete len:208 (+) Transcript_66296:245-868(+)